MKGSELLNEIISKRDYSGSSEDVYAQFVQTLMMQLGPELNPLLEKAHLEDKKLAINSDILESDVLVDQYTIEDIVLI